MIRRQYFASPATKIEGYWFTEIYRPDPYSSKWDLLPTSRWWIVVPLSYDDRKCAPVNELIIDSRWLWTIIDPFDPNNMQPYLSPGHCYWKKEETRRSKGIQVGGEYLSQSMNILDQWQENNSNVQQEPKSTIQSAAQSMTAKSSSSFVEPSIQNPASAVQPPTSRDSFG